MSVKSPIGTLPHYASRMVGRNAEIALIEHLISDADIPIVTITGTAGVGKSRLAATIARMVADDFEHGVIFIPLANISDPDLVPAEIGKALGLMNDYSLEAIKEHLASWNGILLLDNLEQVILAAPDIAAIIPFNPDLTVVTTSQRPLQIAGERVVRLHPLPIPEQDAGDTEIRANTGVQLLLDRAVDLDASLLDDLDDPATITIVGEICRRLDGIPLALELAAPRLVQFSPEVVLAQLDRGYEILSSSRADAPERHRTMHSAITWSFELIPVDTRRIFTRLSLYPSGFDLDLVERVTASVGSATSSFDTISELMSLSMITRVSGGSNPWYTMLVSIREHCMAELIEMGDREAAEDVVAEYVLDLAEQSKDQLTGPNVGEWLIRLSQNLATIRSAVAWALAHENPVVPMSVGARMPYFFETEGLWRELVSWIDTAMQWQDTLPQELVLNAQISKLLLQEAAHDLDSSDITDATIQELLKSNDAPLLELRYLTISGNIAIDRQQWNTAIGKYERTISLAEQKGFPQATSAALANLGNIAHFRGNHAEAENYMVQALTIFENMGNQHSISQALSNLASINTAQGKYQEALSYLQRAATIAESVGLQPQVIYILLGLAEAHYGLLDIDQGDAEAQEAVLQAQTLGFNQLAVMGHNCLASGALIRHDVSSMYEHILLALDLQANAKGMQEYVVLGTLVASALDLESKFKEATTFLGKSLALAEEIEHTYDYSAKQTLDALIERLKSQNPNYDRDLQSGEEWSMEQFVRNMTWAARHNSYHRSSLLIEIPAREDHSDRLMGLTPREVEILRLLINGKSTRQMAEQLSISPRTVTTHIANIMAKMNVSSRSELVARALRNF